MSKKHFEWAAAYVRDMARVWTPTEHERHVRTLCDLFGEFNPCFDEDRFRAACRGMHTPACIAANDASAREVCICRGAA